MAFRMILFNGVFVSLENLGLFQGIWNWEGIDKL